MIIMDTKENREILLKFQLENIQQEFRFSKMKLEDGSPLSQGVLISESAILARCEGYVSLSEKYPNATALVFEKKDGGRQNLRELISEEEQIEDSEEIAKGEDIQNTEENTESDSPNQTSNKRTKTLKKTTSRKKKREVVEKVMEVVEVKEPSQPKQVSNRMTLTNIIDLTISEECGDNYNRFVESLKNDLGDENIEILVRNKNTNKVSRLTSKGSVVS